MDRTKHTISVSTSCRHKGTDCKPGLELIARLRAALDAAGGVFAADFEISGVASMAGCDRPCTVAYHATAKATYLFGDIAPDQDMSDLVAFADQYRARNDGWCSPTTPPEKRHSAPLAKVPAALIYAKDECVQ